MGCSSDAQKPVFIDTNLGTRFAVPVSPEITAKNLKGELERMHLNCFPEFGSVRVVALLVKQSTHCYHLSDSLPIKNSFLGSNDTWFLQMDVHLLNTPHQINSLQRSLKEVHNLNYTPKKRSKCRRKKVKIQRCKAFSELRFKKSGINVIEEDLTKTFSESQSVSGIIKKYFSDCDEVDSNSGTPFTTVQYTPPTPQASRERHSKPQVGKRLLLALDNLGLTPANQRHALSLCWCGDGKSPRQRSVSIARDLVFEITEECG